MFRSVWLFLLLLFSCSAPEQPLPYFGTAVVQRTGSNGKPLINEVGEVIMDTIDFTIPPFSLLDQDSAVITETQMDGKVVVADFFFTHCPTICPKMKAQLLKVYEHFQSDSNLIILSHTIDPKRDTVATLRSFAQKLGIKSGRWHLLTGPRDSLLRLSRAYMTAVYEDAKLPGGFDHSGNFVLVDRHRHIRGFYSGISDTGTARLIADIPKLLNEK